MLNLKGTKHMHVPWMQTYISIRRPVMPSHFNFKQKKCAIHNWIFHAKPVFIFSNPSRVLTHLQTTLFALCWVAESCVVVWFGVLEQSSEAGEDRDTPNWLDVSDRESPFWVLWILWITVSESARAWHKRVIWHCNFKWNSTYIRYKYQKLFKLAGSCVFFNLYFLQCHVFNWVPPLFGEVLALSSLALAVFS